MLDRNMNAQRFTARSDGLLDNNNRQKGIGRDEPRNPSRKKVGHLQGQQASLGHSSSSLEQRVVGAVWDANHMRPKVQMLNNATPSLTDQYALLDARCASHSLQNDARGWDAEHGPRSHAAHLVCSHTLVGHGGGHHAKLQQKRNKERVKHKCIVATGSRDRQVW
ncbi:hypothetical protein NLG97_g2606 [Lecanicillium saksenae]|uniref:Uncharacterized protein n=1 Tax=Lecanicillium saksenae TaxID=468837 RepID=A0ACC1R264_9HYPO|nr:hypothetical protein NLG97_g2606 [Lecanicillium saksenae]